MTTVAWGDPGVTRALREIVLADGDGPRVDADGLREALNERLGARAADLSEAVDALVASAEAGIPQGVLDDVPAIDLGDLLDDAGLEPRAAGWALATWGQVLRAAPVRATPALEVRSATPPDGSRPVLPSEETRPLPRVEAEIATGGEVSAEEPPEEPPEEPVEQPTPSSGLTADPTGEPVAEKPRGIRTVKQRRRLPVPAGVVVAVAALCLVGIFGALAMNGRGENIVTSHTPPARSATTPSASAAAVPASLAVPLAHAGGGETFPLQTQPAMLDAAKRGDLVEADLRWTLDNVPVMYDAASVSGRMVCDRPYAVALTSWATLKSSCRTTKDQSQDGKRYGIPAFDDTVKKLSKVAGSQLYIELKVNQTPAQVATFVGLLRSNGMADRTVVASFDGDRLSAVRKSAKASGTTGLRYLRYVRDTSLSAEAGEAAGLDAVGLHHTEATADYVKKMQDKGIQVVLWTLNKPGQWAKARELGVDAVLTDKPTAYRAWFAQQ